jgi:hypothetical protein
MPQEVHHPHYTKSFLRLRSTPFQPPELNPKILKIRPFEHRVLQKTESILSPPFVIAAFHTFEEWLEGELGREVHYRILNNRHAVNLEGLAAYFDTIEDVQQKALIWLWLHWQNDPQFTRFTRGANTLSHQAGILTKIALKGGRCMYAKRRTEGREKQADLFFEDGMERPQFVLMATTTMHSSELEENDNCTDTLDKRFDMSQAIERVVAQMVYHYAVSAGNNRRVAIEHITRTIIEGYMHHYTDRYSQTGSFRQFCEAKGISKAQVERWRPIIFAMLGEELLADIPYRA